MGAKAIEVLVNEDYGKGKVIGIVDEDVVAIDIEEALSMKRDTHENLLSLINMLQ